MNQTIYIDYKSSQLSADVKLNTTLRAYLGREREIFDGVLWRSLQGKNDLWKKEHYFC